MPNEDNMMFVRPKNCRYCGHGYHGLYHVVEYAQQKEQWNITDISAEQANKGPVYDALNDTDPLSFYGFGHGLDCRYTGDLEQDIFSCDDCSILSERVVYLLSCLTANGLGPKIIENGALAYAGFNISWTWLSQTGTDGDPYDDRYAFGFWESANELWMALLDGYDFQESVQKSIDRYDAWIDYWFYEEPEDPESQNCIMWLIHDRDGLVALDKCMNYSNQENCETGGCYWYNNICNSVPKTIDEEGMSLGIVGLIPIIALIGIVLIAGQTKTAKS